MANPRTSYNLQRPEAVEAFFVMYRITGDSKYQEYGWEVFSAFESFTKVSHVGLHSLLAVAPEKDRGGVLLECVGACHRDFCLLVCQVDDGYTGIKDVTRVPMVRDDTMQSFWLAETLKYLYLLFAPADKISLDEWVCPLTIMMFESPNPLSSNSRSDLERRLLLHQVLNTEAHPMKIHPWKYQTQTQ